MDKAMYEHKTGYPGEMDRLVAPRLADPEGKPPAIEIALGELNAQVERLEHQFALLAQKLTPVLPEKVGPAVHASDNGFGESPLARRISTVSRRVEAVADFLGHLSVAVEL